MIATAGPLGVALGGSVDENEVKLLVAGIAASATVVAVVVGALVSHLASRSTRRRATYGEALKSVVSWAEMPHRVRRRDPSEERSLVARFHQLQEEFAYHRGLIGSESKYLERAYARLVRTVKEAAAEPIQRAWEEVASSHDPTLDVDVSAALAAFLRDVRSHLSPWPWRKLALMMRNRGAAQR